MTHDDTRSTSLDEVDSLARAAQRAFRVALSANDATRAAWLRAIADALDGASAALVDIAYEETSLPAARLAGEVARTTGQLRMFAGVVEEGAYLEAILDAADSEATPPRPDLRRILRPLGPVAVYSASNFPFAFSVAGGDTASALAVGCPVIVKGHSAHPRLSVATARVVSDALAQAGAPAGMFALILGREAGVALVEHPAITAAGFTGSLGGGRALFDRAAARPTPIPFYGELASINPVVVTEAADAARGESLAAGLAASFQMGMGQFCTKPGLVFVPAGSVLERAIGAHVAAPAHSMLAPSLLSSFEHDLAELSDVPGIARIADGGEGENGAPAPRVFTVDIGAFDTHAARLTDEVFGPVTVLVHYRDLAQVLEVLDGLEGSLTGTVHAEAGEDVSALAEALAATAGRVLFDGWPTGVAVTWSQHHGGPFPATTSIHTSVGATAVRRFQRPVVFQDAPAQVLPAALRDGNPLAIPRRENGVLVAG